MADLDLSEFLLPDFYRVVNRHWIERFPCKIVDIFHLSVQACCFTAANGAGIKEKPRRIFVQRFLDGLEVDRRISDLIQSNTLGILRQQPQIDFLPIVTLKADRNDGKSDKNVIAIMGNVERTPVRHIPDIRTSFAGGVLLLD